MKPDGTLFVLDYPIPFDDVSERPCIESRVLGENDVALVNLFASRLDETIAEAVKLANQILDDGNERVGNVTLVPWRTSTEGPTSTYAFQLPGHAEPSAVPYNPGGLCGKNPMIIGFGPLAQDREFGDSLHPSAEGVRIAGCRLGLDVSELESLHLAQPAFNSTGC